MATSFINATANDIGTTETTVYTVAANDKALLIGCNAANIFGSIVPFNLLLRRSGVDTYIAKELRVKNGENVEVMKGRIVMVAGDQLVATAGIDAAYDVIASLLTGVK
tara:strand:- start:11 stop:334 length:324 start_codon:yes stop_codon:yes gene_type:complete